MITHLQLELRLRMGGAVPPLFHMSEQQVLRLLFILITIIQTIYMENMIRINAGNGISEDSTVFTRGVRQGCSLSPVLFNLYLDEVIRKWLKKLKTSNYFKELIFNTLLFADDQFITSDTENNLQRAVYSLYNILEEYNLEIATKRRRYLVSLGQIT